MRLLDQGGSSPSEANNLMSKVILDMMGFQDQEKLLLTKGTRKKWFGSTDRSFFTHVHASDPAIPRNAMGTSWNKIADLFFEGKRLTGEDKERFNAAAKSGDLRSAGFRNPNSDPMAQLAGIWNIITPDMARELNLDLDLSNDVLVFHPDTVKGQGGDNDSDMSQVAGVTRFPNNRPINKYPLTEPWAVTEAAIHHSAGEYQDVLKKLHASPEATTRDILGFDPTRPAVEMLGQEFHESQISASTLQNHELKSVQIGQTYNVPIKAALNMTSHKAAKDRVSSYAGHIYQNPLDAKVYEEGTPEHRLLVFLGSWYAVRGTYHLSGGVGPDF
jgi:hypothetical protein